MSDGWNKSAAAWIADMGAQGDYARQYILDAPMQARIAGRGFGSALDVGCGEGRFCRLMKESGVAAVGIDPTAALLEQARKLDPGGDYRIGRAEALPFGTGEFDLVVSYLTLVDIADAGGAIAEMIRVLRPGGTLLIANLTSYITAGETDGWVTGPDGKARFCIDHYMEERASWVSWRGIRVRNWHRPLSRYFALLLGQGLSLRHYAEPCPRGR